VKDFIKRSFFDLRMAPANAVSADAKGLDGGESGRVVILSGCPENGAPPGEDGRAREIFTARV